MAATNTSVCTHDDVKEYYGKTLKASTDLKTNVCCVGKRSLPQAAKEAMKLIHPNVMAKNYGCGAVFPECVQGCSVLDLGSGAGIDCFVLSKLVGPDGRVVGIDMTTEQLEVARRYISYHTEQFGYSQPNVEFKEGIMERLDLAGVKDSTFDIIVSNCVINLAPDKRAVLEEAYRVLKPGGEMYFSDIYANHPVPESLKANKVLWGECISGALYWRDLMKISTEVGFAPPVLVSSTLLSSNDPELEKLQAAADGIQFASATYRLFKLQERLPPSDSDPLMTVTYKGTIPGYLDSVPFFQYGTLSAQTSTVVPASVTQLILQSRLALYFTVEPTPACSTVEPLCPSLSDFLEVNPFETTPAHAAVGNVSSAATNSCCC